MAQGFGLFHVRGISWRGIVQLMNQTRECPESDRNHMMTPSGISVPAEVRENFVKGGITNKGVAGAILSLLCNNLSINFPDFDSVPEAGTIGCHRWGGGSVEAPALSPKSWSVGSPDTTGSATTPGFAGCCTTLRFGAETVT